MNAHPHGDDLSALALGALDADEAQLVRVHLAACPRCRATVKAYDTVVCLLPYAASPHAPPARLKWQLLARVATSEVFDSTQGRSMMNEHTNCHVEPVEKPLDEAALANSSTVYLVIQGMGCPRCAMRVRNGLLELDGVLAVEVFLEESMAVAAFDPERVETGELIAAVAAAGGDGRHHYQAQLIGRAPAASTLAQ